MHRKKIVWIAHESNKSGANLCLLEFMESLSKLEYEQLVILPHNGNMEASVEKLGIQSQIIHFYSWVRPTHVKLTFSNLFKRNARNLIAVMQLIILFIKFKPNVIFSNTSTVNVGAIANLFYRAKHLWYIHEMGEEDFNFKLPWGRFSYKFINWTSNYVLTNSNQLKRKYKLRYDKMNLIVLRNIVNIKNVEQVVAYEENSTFRLLLLGQITESKGHLIAMEAMSILKSMGYSVSLSVVGSANDAAFYATMKSSIHDLNIKDVVTIFQYSENVSGLIASHHALLMCSKCEAFGRVTIEAMKIGIPVIGSNTCGTVELIEHERSGLLYEQGNPSGLANEVIKLIKYPELKERIIKEAKNHAEDLVSEKHILNFFENEL